MLIRYQRNSGRRIEEHAAQAEQLLTSSRDPGGDGCMALTETLLIDGRTAPWTRIRLLLENNQSGAIKRVLPFLPPADAERVTQAVERPGAWLKANERDLAKHRDVAHLAIARLARDDPQLAARWAQLLDPHLTPEQRGQVWGRIGHIAAVRLLPEALQYYQRGGEWVGSAPHTARADEILEWHVRAALRGTALGPDWTTVRATVERMPDALRREPAWRYWHARALLAEGEAGARLEEARATLAAIANQFSFYGKLAAEELGQPIEIPPRPEPPSPELVAAFEGNEALERALLLLDQGMRFEASREWSWAIRTANFGRGLNDRELLALAEFARRRGAFDRMIAASERTRAEVDFAQRFPAPHRERLAYHATAVGIDEPWVYGLIRQESRFAANARSVVGAQGLMQLMPATARYVARRVGMSDYTPARIHEPDVNLRLGVNYLRLVADDLDGHPVLASAAYNAGPSRPRAWRAALPAAVEGAIFAETIPIPETREYVKNVMSNTVYYALLFNGSSRSLKERLGVIAPKAAGKTELP
ncbi:MAG TPA: transglycosylase SLT domain-containing protein [Burkholderiaceae bacterium]|nr:transglycosylase SLT domain-containing protein [Burkholderiaceae bacterium]